MSYSKLFYVYIFVVVYFVDLLFDLATSDKKQRGSFIN